MVFLRKENWRNVRDNWNNPDNPISSNDISMQINLVPPGSKDVISTILEVYVSGEYIKQGRSVKARQRFKVNLKYTPKTVESVASDLTEMLTSKFIEIYPEFVNNLRIESPENIENLLSEIAEEKLFKQQIRKKRSKQITRSGKKRPKLSEDTRTKLSKLMKARWRRTKLVNKRLKSKGFNVKGGVRQVFRDPGKYETMLTKMR